MSEELNEAYDRYQDLMSDGLGIRYLGYNSSINDDIYNVMRLSSIGHRGALSSFSTNIAKRLSISENYVELIKYLLCQEDNADYGTSPRGAWLTPKGKDLYLRLKKLKKYIAILEGKQ